MLLRCFVAVNKYVLVCNYLNPDKRDLRPSKNSTYVNKAMRINPFSLEYVPDHLKNERDV